LCSWVDGNYSGTLPAAGKTTRIRCPERPRGPIGSTYARAPRLETSPRHQQNCTNCHKENARPVRSEPQESHVAPWRLQSVANRPVGGIRAAKRSPPIAVRAIYKTPPRTSGAKPDQEHSGLSQLIAAARNRTWIQADGGRIVPAAGTIVAVRVLDRPARINLRAFFTKRTVSGSPLGPSAFIDDWECCAPACFSGGARHARDSKIYLTTTPNYPAPLLGMPIAHGDSADRESPRGF
jgi:hypothetical protein